MKKIVLLGSTGSVGKNVLDIVRRFPGEFCLKAVAGNSNLDLLSKQVDEFNPEFVSVADKRFYPDLKEKIKGNVKISAGEESLEALASDKEADIIFIAISGRAALRSLISALKEGKTIALASKEPVVSAGSLIDKIQKQTIAHIIPVDSEHSAIMQCLAGRCSEDVRSLYITGSGGSLKDMTSEKFDSLTMEQVLNHPTWDMGKKITVDSATLMNKGLEVIEARWLFDISPEKIKVLIHPQAVIHSMVEFLDGTISASLFRPDMRFPILKALSYPEIMESDLPRVDFSVINNLSFSAPDTDKFPALAMAFEAIKQGGTVPAVLNASNEEAVRLFLEKKILFTDIIKKVEKVIRKHEKIQDPTLGDIISAEEWAVEEVLS